MEAPAPDYRLDHPAEIVAILERLCDEAALTTVEFGGGHAIVSRLLAVRRDSAALVFDIARDGETNRALFGASSLTFVGELDHIQIAFETGAPMRVALADGPAALVDFPDAVTRLQRREWFRADVPLHPPVRCTVLDHHGNASSAQVLDLSRGGAGVAVDDAAFAAAMPGSDHELVLSLPEVGRVELDATLRTVRADAAAGGDAGARLRLGFRFDAVSGETAKRLQRYVQRLEVTQLRVLRLRER